RLAILLIFCLFFSCYRPPRALHSFPTRRSSDLWLPGTVIRSEAQILVEPVRFDNFAGVHLPLRIPDCFELAKCLYEFCPKHFRQDRKSTRLNSSHVAISYAVFCLKKKKKSKNTY